ncbi:MAG: hypothetical protein M3P51_06940 [Chloroflexota bacterium]|nr:hypothetical protein [Chloroflexota bacterium]
MNLALVHRGAEFDTWDHLDTELAARCLGLRDARDGIVIRDGYGLQSGLLSEADELGRRVLSVRLVRMRVQINRSRYQTGASC